VNLNTTETDNEHSLVSKMTHNTKNYILEIHSVRWFLSLFCVDLPLQSAKTVLDLYIIDGPIVFVRAALAMFKVLEAAIISDTTIDTLGSTSTQHIPFGRQMVVTESTDFKSKWSDEPSFDEEQRINTLLKDGLLKLFENKCITRKSFFEGPYARFEKLVD
jgi:hypothetical protein